jgi:gamma-glutamylcyclotransferase (GGCT)/AIG2-like uncharacterized protein YtfP
MKEYLFTYGMFRDAARPLLGDYINCGRSHVRGKLYRVNEFYPGYVEGDDGVVSGDVYLIDPSIFPELDEFEGDEYRRKKLLTTNDLECWVYEYQKDVSSFKEIKSGDWILR